MEALFFLDAAERNHDADLDERDPDPRWTANREVRFAVKAYSTFADDVTTEMVGLPAEPVTESVLEEWDPHVISWKKCFERFHATMWAYLISTKITTRTAKVFKILVDRTNHSIIVQRSNRFSVNGTETVWREGAGDLAGAVDRARHFEWAARLRGDNARIVTFAAKERKLIILDGNKVIYRPDQKGAPEHGRKSYGSREEARAAARNIYAWAQAQGFTVRAWNKPVKVRKGTRPASPAFAGGGPPPFCLRPESGRGAHNPGGGGRWIPTTCCEIRRRRSRNERSIGGRRGGRPVRRGRVLPRRDHASEGRLTTTSSAAIRSKASSVES